MMPASSSLMSHTLRKSDRDAQNSLCSLVPHCQVGRNVDVAEKGSQSITHFEPSGDDQSIFTALDSFQSTSRIACLCPFAERHEVGAQSCVLLLASWPVGRSGLTFSIGRLLYGTAGKDANRMQREYGDS